MADQMDPRAARRFWPQLIASSLPNSPNCQLSRRVLISIYGRGNEVSRLRHRCARKLAAIYGIFNKPWIPPSNPSQGARGRGGGGRGGSGRRRSCYARYFRSAERIVEQKDRGVKRERGGGGNVYKANRGNRSA
jgi:hypothetical protein